MKLNVRLFARARDLAGAEQLTVELPDGASVGDLRMCLPETCPALKPLAAHLLIAVDADYASDALPLQAGTEVACFPPVSGG